MSNDAHAFAAQQAFLRERLYTLLAILHPVLRLDVERALSEKGKLLSLMPGEVDSSPSTQPAGIWCLLTLFVARHVSPGIDLVTAGNVALAVECFVCALDLLDDVEDEDQTPVVQDLGTARALNTSTALLALAQHGILALRQYAVSPPLILRLVQAFHECLLDAVAGQHRDLLAEQRSAREYTREECIEIAAGKAGAIMRLACVAGAICAGAKKSVREQFAQLGMELGIAHQLDNDAHDLYHLLHYESSSTIDAGTVRKSDLGRGKKTLPIVLGALRWLEQRREEDALSGDLDAALKNLAGVSDREKEVLKQFLNEGILVTWGICLLYRERAREHLQEIEAHNAVAAELRQLLGFESSQPGM